MKVSRQFTRLPLIAPLLTTGTFAIPKVSTVPLGSNDCARWPGYVDFDYTSPVYLVVDSAENSTANGLLTTVQEFTVPGTNTSSTRLVVSMNNSASTVKLPSYRCHSGQLRLPGPNYDPTAAVVGETLITVHRDYQNSFPILSEDGLRIAPYHHEIDWVEGEDVYLGTRGRTTFGFKYFDGGYFEIKLQGGTPEEYDGESVKGWDPEFYGFLKVVTE
ncbi:hypothetical protein V8F33_011084 [Rhypophila sp. PSN 637]